MRKIHSKDTHFLRHTENLCFFRTLYEVSLLNCISLIFYLIIGTELGFQEMNILFYWSDFLTEYIVLVHIFR